jgi:DNA-binding MarR family transcriptional regulator
MAHSQKKTLKSSQKNASVKSKNGGQRTAEFNVGSSLRHTFRFMDQRLQALLQTRDIPVGMFYFLLTLWKADGLTQRELSDRVGIMAPGTVEQLQRMEQRGLIRRVHSRTDRRKIHVFLTRKGRTLTTELLPLAQQNNSLALRGISSSDVQVLRRCLSRIRENMMSVEADADNRSNIEGSAGHTGRT